VLSDQDAALVKQAVASAAVAARAAKTRHYILFATPQAACKFVNTNPAQGAGGVSVSVRENGQVDTFYFL
jgi:hypothetical protein